MTWAEVLFQSFDPPVLTEQVYVAIMSWESGRRGPSGLSGSVASVEKEIIALASVMPDAMLLNVDGR